MPDENSRKISPSPLDSSPQRFLRLFHGMAFLSSCIILSIACYFIITHSRNNLLHEAESTALKVSESLVNEVLETIQFVSINSKRSLHVDPQNIMRLDQQVRMYLQPFDIVKIKIYNFDKRIVFSTESELIGKKDPDNARLLKALDGVPQTELVRKASILDLAEEKRFDVDIVESYVPVLDTDKRVVGVFEVYTDISKAKKTFQKNTGIAIASLALMLILVNAFYYMLVRKETKLLKSTQQQLRDMAITDSLTGMHNRRYVIKRLEDEFSKMNRQKERVPGVGIGCIMIDIDDFKKVNDTYGHNTGDEVLCEVARRISLAVRQYDIPGRFGGEEFVVVLPDVSRAEVMPVAERIRMQINSELFRMEHIEKRVSVSMGLAWSESGNEADPVKEILKRSDDGLYIAKERGKNTIVDLTT